MRLEIVKVHLFKKEKKYMLINSLIKVKFLLKMEKRNIILKKNQMKQNLIIIQKNLKDIILF